MRFHACAPVVPWQTRRPPPSPAQFCASESTRGAGAGGPGPTGGPARRLAAPARARFRRRSAGDGLSPRPARHARPRSRSRKRRSFDLGRRGPRAMRPVEPIPAAPGAELQNWRRLPRRVRPRRSSSSVGRSIAEAGDPWRHSRRRISRCASQRRRRRSPGATGGSSRVPPAVGAAPFLSRHGTGAGFVPQDEKTSSRWSPRSASSGERSVCSRPKVWVAASTPARWRWTETVSAIGSTSQYSVTPCLP